MQGRAMTRTFSGGRTLVEGGKEGSPVGVMGWDLVHHFQGGAAVEEVPSTSIREEERNESKGCFLLPKNPPIRNRTNKHKCQEGVEKARHESKVRLSPRQQIFSHETQDQQTHMSKRRKDYDREKAHPVLEVRWTLESSAGPVTATTTAMRSQDRAMSIHQSPLHGNDEGMLQTCKRNSTDSSLSLIPRNVNLNGSSDSG